MADKEPKHKKMYANSPRIESDENGKKVIRRDAPESKAAQTEKVAEGVDVRQKNMVELMQKQAAERFDLYQKHEKAHMELAQKMSLGAEPETETEGE